MNRTWLLNAAADLGSLILYVVALCGVILAVGFAAILITRLGVELVRTARGKQRRQLDPVSVPFGGPGGVGGVGPVDMPPGFENATPEEAAEAAARASLAQQKQERAQARADMSAGLNHFGGIPADGTAARWIPADGKSDR